MTPVAEKVAASFRSIGDVAGRRRRALDLTAAAVAERIAAAPGLADVDVDESTILGVEHGEVDPSHLVLAAHARALGIDLADFFRDDTAQR